jgi:NosR/NirI family nitrous oxide reductase transcriptional regulator
MFNNPRSLLQSILDSPNGDTCRPVIDANFESSVDGLFVIGDLAGAPVVKLAMAQGSQVAEYIAARPDAKTATSSGHPNRYDLLVIGAGASGLNAALGAEEHGLRVMVLEKNRIANTIEDFPEGKWIYAEPESMPPQGKLWLEGASKEDLLARWRQIIAEHRLEVRTDEGVTGLTKRKEGGFEIRTDRGAYFATRVVLATGQRGNARKLGVPGEDRENVHHRLYSPRHYKDEEILVAGGGNSAVEAALALSEQNRVTISYRGSEFGRVFKDNRRKLTGALEAGRIRVIFRSRVKRFDDGMCALEVDGGGVVPVKYDRAFVLIGADPPAEFLRSLGLRLEGDWTGSPLLAGALVAATFLALWYLGAGHAIGSLMAGAAFGSLIYLGVRGSRFAWLGVSFTIAYTIYGVKQAENFEYWPFRGWGAHAFAFFGRPWSFWYTVLYSLVMTVFGIQALKRWGIDKRDRFQIWRYVSLIGFQWIFFFLIPEFLFQWAVKYQWVGHKLATDPTFAGQAWRSYGLIYAWPLFFYTFFNGPHEVWIVWGALLAFVIIPVLVLFHGKRYCSWVCGCGGLAETLGDRWRHLAPKGETARRWESMNTVVLWAAVVVTILMLGRDAVTFFRKPAGMGLEYYHVFADVWLVGILPVALYPFFGGKVWCRYWCPLAKFMQILSAWYTRWGISRFAIHSNDKCIACGECSRNCQVGIDVMQFALKQEELNNLNSSCIGCGICVTVCPMDVLSFTASGRSESKLVQIA